MMAPALVRVNDAMQANNTCWRGKDGLRGRLDRRSMAARGLRPIAAKSGQRADVAVVAAHRDAGRTVELPGPFALSAEARLEGERGAGVGFLAAPPAPPTKARTRTLRR